MRVVFGGIEIELRSCEVALEVAQVGLPLVLVLVLLNWEVVAGVEIPKLFLGVDAEITSFEGEGVLGVDKAVAALVLAKVVVGLDSPLRNNLTHVLGPVLEVGQVSIIHDDVGWIMNCLELLVSFLSLEFSLLGWIWDRHDDYIWVAILFTGLYVSGGSDGAFPLSLPIPLSSWDFDGWLCGWRFHLFQINKKSWFHILVDIVVGLGFESVDLFWVVYFVCKILVDLLDDKGVVGFGPWFFPFILVCFLPSGGVTVFVGVGAHFYDGVGGGDFRFEVLGMIVGRLILINGELVDVWGSKVAVEIGVGEGVVAVVVFGGFSPWHLFCFWFYLC